MPSGWYMIRHATPLLYTFELVVAAAVGALVLVRWWRAGEAAAVGAYLVAALYGTGIELLAQGSSARVIEDARLLGSIPLRFPLLPFVLGFFEAGVLLLVGFWILRAVLARDAAAARLAAGVTLALLVVIVLGTLGTRAMLAQDPQALRLTTRALGAPRALLLLAGCWAVAIAWAAARREARRGLVIWYLGVAAVAVCWYTPALVGGVRFAGTVRDGVRIAGDALEQLAVFYGFSVGFEAVGFYLPVYVLLDLLGLVPHGRG